MKNKNIILTALIFIMGICLALPSFAQIYKEDIEETVQQFENNLDINIIPDNVSGQQLVSFLNVAVNKRNIAVVKEILGKGANLQGSEDIYYQDPFDMKAFATVMSNYDKAGKEVIDILFDNNMIIKEEHAQIVKNLTTSRQCEIHYPIDRLWRYPLSSEKIQKMCESTSSNDIRKCWLPELRRVEKEEKLIARLEQKRLAQQEEFSKQVKEALTRIYAEKLNQMEQLVK